MKKIILDDTDELKIYCGNRLIVNISLKSILYNSLSPDAFERFVSNYDKSNFRFILKEKEEN